MLGHLLGGAGGVETAVTVLSIRDQRIHPSINVDGSIPSWRSSTSRGSSARSICDTPSRCRQGFGGHNCALVLGRYASA